MSANLGQKSHQLVQGAAHTRASSRAHGLPVKGCGSKQTADWNYMHHASKWAWHDDHGFYPCVSRMSLRPGVNGMADKGDDTVARAELARRKWTVIEIDDPRMAEHFGPGFSYVRTFVTEKNIKLFVSPWERPDVVGNKTYWVSDQPERFAFLKFLVDREIVPPMSPHIRSEHIRRVESRISKLQQDNEASPMNGYIKSRLVAAEKRLKKMQAWGRPVAPEPTPEPTPEPKSLQAEPPKATVKRKVTPSVTLKPTPSKVSRKRKKQ